MKGLGLILTLFTITVLFTQCRYDDTCGGGDSSSPKKEITGMTGFYTEFFGDSMSPTILISADYSYAISKPHFNFINSV